MEPESYFEEQDVADVALYRPGDVAMATLVGTPVAGAVLSGINSVHLGRPRERWVTFVGAVLAVVIMIGLFRYLPIEASLTLGLLSIAVMYKLEKALHGKALAEHVLRGGGHPSAWNAVGIGLLCLVSILFLAGAYAAGEGELGEELNFILRTVLEGEDYLGEYAEASWSTLEVPPSDIVYYAGNATEEDARTLARVMADQGWFGADGADAYLEDYPTETVVSIVLTEDFDSPETRSWCRELGKALDDAGLGYDLTIELWDTDGNVRNTISVE